MPKHRSTSSKRKRRASHFAMKTRQLATCPKCNDVVMPHQTCASCGTYAGRQVLTLKNPIAKKKRTKATEK